MNIVEFISNWWKEVLEYKERVLKDGGTTKREDVVQQYNQMCKSNGIFDSIKFAWLGEAGGKFRDSGANRFWTKIYSFVTTNDATQTTSTLQPYITGNIAPTERIGLKNPNGGSVYMTHPTISFAANEAWSVTTVANWNGDLASSYFCGDGSSNAIGVKIGAGANSNVLGIINTPNSLSTIRTDTYIGKNPIYSFIYNRVNIAFYVNGVQRQIINNQFTIVLSKLIEGLTSGNNFDGSIFAHIIRAQALTATQVAAEANFLRTLYPEIPSVTIGSKVIATSNFEVVASSNGTLITDGNVQTTWASNAAAYWCHHTDIATGAIYGKLYNKQARDIIIANPPPGWHVATKAELTTLAANGGNALKKDGITYWTTTGGTNSTGFTAIGGASRNADGTFNTIKNTATFWCADSDEVLQLNHNDNTATIVATTSAKGHSIRLVKD